MLDKPETRAMAQNFELLGQDAGFGRVYYKGQKDRVTYCIQVDSGGVLNFYECSKDGEPSWPCCAFPVEDRFMPFIRPDKPTEASCGR
jgi:hypothetical protein